MKIKSNTFIILLISIFISQFSFGSECQLNQIEKHENILMAQTDDSSPHFGRRGQFPKGKGPNFKRFEKFRQRKLLELLELNDSQIEKFKPIMQKLLNDGHQLINDKIDVTDSLTAELKQDNPDDQKIIEYINKILRLNEKHEQMRTKLHLDVKLFLTPVQLGRLIIFEERFHKRAMEKVFDEHRRMGFGPGSGKHQFEKNIDN